MENNNEKRLSFPQRYWLLLCILVAILSPVLVHYLNVGARQYNYKEATERRPPNGNDSGTGERNVNAGAQNVNGNDTSRIAAPAQNGQGGAKPGSGGH